MRILFSLLAALAFAASAVPVRAADDPVHYVQKLVEGMVAVSKKPTAERRAYYDALLEREVDWNGPAEQALGARFASLSDDERGKLADWARASVLGYKPLMRFIQNLVFNSCAISGKHVAEVSQIRFICSRFGADPNFTARFDVARIGGRFRIVDIGHIGVSLREELSKELFQKDAVEEHGVKVDLASLKK